ncbi:MAG: sulfotransferase family protein [Actinomycetota bacterium]
MAGLTAAVRSRRAKLGRAVAKLRGNGALPAFAVIGAQRCGTTTLFAMLSQHPAVGVPFRKEIHFFDRDVYERGEHFYRSFFPSPGQLLSRGEMLTGEATPDYLFHPLGARRVAAMLPEARFIVLLRDPVVRAWSHHALHASRGREPLSFEDAIDAEDERVGGERERILSNPAHPATTYLRYSYVGRGDYAPQLREWFAAIPRARFLVVVSEEFFGNPHRTLREIEMFLELPPWEAAPQAEHRHAIGGGAAAMRPETRAQLRSFFAPRIRATENLLGRVLPWDRS